MRLLAEVRLQHPHRLLQVGADRAALGLQLRHQAQGVLGAEDQLGGLEQLAGPAGQPARPSLPTPMMWMRVSGSHSTCTLCRLWPPFMSYHWRGADSTGKLVRAFCSHTIWVFVNKIPSEPEA